MKKFIDDLIEDGVSNMELFIGGAFVVINLVAAVIHIVTF